GAAVERNLFVTFVIVPVRLPDAQDGIARPDEPARRRERQQRGGKLYRRHDGQLGQHVAGRHLAIGGAIRLVLRPLERGDGGQVWKIRRRRIRGEERAERTAVDVEVAARC